MTIVVTNKHSVSYQFLVQIGVEIQSTAIRSHNKSNLEQIIPPHGATGTRINCPQLPHLQMSVDSGACTTARQLGHTHATTFVIGGVVRGAVAKPGGGGLGWALPAPNADNSYRS